MLEVCTSENGYRPCGLSERFRAEAGAIRRSPGSVRASGPPRSSPVGPGKLGDLIISAGPAQKMPKPTQTPRPALTPGQRFTGLQQGGR